MKTIDIVSGVLGFASFIVGCFISFSPNSTEKTTGGILVQGGSVIIAGLLIRLAIIKSKRRS